jgi:hypothetical protein
MILTVPLVCEEALWPEFAKTIAAAAKAKPRIG